MNVHFQRSTGATHTYQWSIPALFDDEQINLLARVGIIAKVPILLQTFCTFEMNVQAECTHTFLSEHGIIGVKWSCSTYTILCTRRAKRQPYSRTRPYICVHIVNKKAVHSTQTLDLITKGAGKRHGGSSRSSTEYILCLFYASCCCCWPVGPRTRIQLVWVMGKHVRLAFAASSGCFLGIVVEWLFRDGTECQQTKTNR